MAYEKVWQFIPNFVPTNATNNGITAPSSTFRHMIWFWSRVLLGDQTALTFKDDSGVTIGGGAVTGKWWVWGSCDGTSFSNGGTAGSPATDYWTSTFNATKITQAAAASNHSWIVLGSPSNFGGTGVGPFYIIIDCNTATNISVSVLFAKTAPNVNGAANSAPTSTDQVALDTNPAVAFSTTVPTNYHISAILSTDGMARFFWSRDGAGGIQGMLSIEAFAGAFATDLWPAALCLCFPTTLNTTAWPFGLAGHNVNTASWAPSTPNGLWRGRSYDGSITCHFIPIMPGFHNSAGTLIDINTTYLTNSVNGKWDSLPCFGMIGVPTEAPGWRGRLYDIGWCNARKNASPTALSDSTFDSTNKVMVVGDTWQPAIEAHLL